MVLLSKIERALVSAWTHKRSGALAAIKEGRVGLLNCHSRQRIQSCCEVETRAESITALRHESCGSICHSTGLLWQQQTTHDLLETSWVISLAEAEALHADLHAVA